MFMIRSMCVPPEFILFQNEQHNSLACFNQIAKSDLAAPLGQNLFVIIRKIYFHGQLFKNYSEKVEQKYQSFHNLNLLTRF